MQFNFRLVWVYLSFNQYWELSVQFQKLKHEKNNYWVIGKQTQHRNTYKDFIAHFEYGCFWIV